MKKEPFKFSSSDVIIREIQPDDNKAIAAVIRTVLKEHGVDRPGTVYTDPTTDSLYELFGQPGSKYFVATYGQEVIGGCGIYPTEGLPEGCAELVKLYVLESYRGIGLGRALIQRSFEFAANHYKSLYLETMPELANAVSLYEDLGFKNLDQRMGNSGHFSCHIWMLKQLD